VVLEATRALEEKLLLYPATANDRVAREKLMAEMEPILALVPSSVKGRRVDVQIIGPDGKEIWIDVGTTHLTKISTEKSCFRFFKGKGATTKEMSPAVRAAAKRKHRHYRPLVQMALQQKRRGRRKNSPTFAACVVSHRGELSHDFFALIEWLCVYRFREVARSAQIDGISPNRATAEFRQGFKDAIATVLFRGVGNMFLSAGFPGAAGGSV
jgi:hypothetical protein